MAGGPRVVATAPGASPRRLRRCQQGADTGLVAAYGCGDQFAGNTARGAAAAWLHGCVNRIFGRADHETVAAGGDGSAGARGMPWILSLPAPLLREFWHSKGG
jgi:hypothetical protein